MGRDVDVLLSDGTPVHMRQIEPEDADGVVAMHSRFSARTRYLRYFSPYPRIPARDLHRFVNVDHVDREAFVVVRKQSTDSAQAADRLIAIGRYERLGPDAPDAEVAFVVEDAYQGRGVGSVLLEHLAAAAREVGITRFVAEVLPENGAMLRVFTDAGYEVTRRYADGVVHLTFPVAPTDRLLAIQWERERRTEARSMARLMRPSTIAVYGASASGKGVGAALLEHIRSGGFTGSIHPIHPRAAQTSAGGAGVAASGVHHPVRSAIEVPEPVDLAVVATPPDAMEAVLDDAASAGVHGLLVISDLDPAQRSSLVRAARAAGMRLIGPGSLGIADQAARLNATLLPGLPEPGRVALFSHSGTLGLQLMAEAHRRGLGVSSFISVGRRADVSGNDLLQFWAGDPETDVIAMYLETFGNPRKFARIARMVGRHKPVVILSGRTGVAGSTLDDATMQALRVQSGVIEVATVAELFDVASLAARAPLPAGDRIGVVSNAFALAALAGAELRAHGLTVGRTSAVGPAASAEELAAAVHTTLHSDDADAVVVIVAPPLPTGAMTVDEASENALLAPYAQALAEVAVDTEKPIVASFLAGQGPANVPWYRSIEEAVRALGHVARRARWLREPVGVMPPSPVLGNVDDLSLDDLLTQYGVPVVPSRAASSADEAVAVAEELGYPIALKVVDHPHRIDLGAVRLDLAGEAELRRSYAELEKLFGAGIRVTAQPMVAPGVACVIEAIDDPAYGPVISFGLGGPITDLVGDRAWRAAPLTDRDAAALVRAPKAAALLTGAAGGPPVDLDELARLLVRIGQLTDEVPRLRRLTLNPVLARPDGWSVLHAAGELADHAPRPDTGPRQLLFR